jgi:hypothetical protein
MSVAAQDGNRFPHENSEDKVEDGADAAKKRRANRKSEEDKAQ